MRMRLASRITLSFMLLTIAIGSVAGTLIYRLGVQSFTTAAASQLLAVAIEKDSDLRHWLEERANDLKLLAAEPDVAEYVEALVIAAPGSRAARAAHDNLLRQIEPHMSLAHSDFLELFVIAANSGKVVASTSPSEEGKSKIGHPYFDNGRNDFYLQTPYISSDIKIPTITEAIPLRSSDGRLLAVLAARLSLDSLNAIVTRRTGLNQTDESYLVNRDRFVIVQPRLMTGPAVLRRQLNTNVTSHCAEGSTQVIATIDYRDAPVFSVCRWNDAHQLGLIVKIDQYEALASAGSFRSLVISITLTALATVAFLSFTLARSIARPLSNLQAEVRNFVEDITMDIPPDSGDEVALLSAEFSRMKERVVRRTSELANATHALQAENAERGKVEEELRRETAFFYAMVRSSFYGILVVNAEGRKILQNQRTVELWKIPKHVVDDPDDSQQVRWVTNMTKDPEQFVGKVKYLYSHPEEISRDIVELKDGTILDRYSSPVLGRDGINYGRIWAFYDITDIKRAEAILEQLRSSRELILQTVADGIHGIDTDGNIVFENTASVRMLGWEVDGLIGKPAHATMHHSHSDGSPYPRDQCHIYAVLRDGLEHRVNDEVFWRRDGTCFPVEYIASPMRDDENRITGAVVLFRDVTERRRIEDRLRLAASIIENTNEGVIVANAQLRIESVNPAFEEITGYPAAEAVGQGLKLLFSGKHDEDFFSTLHGIVDARGVWQGEIWNRRKNGEVYPQQSTINVLRDHAGDVQHYVVIFSDVTVQKQMMEQLRELSIIDALTGIANRREFDDSMIREWSRCMRDGQPLALILIDIDFFKNYNDHYGHQAGDHCLRQVAQTIRESMRRASDLAARYGGEEFAVILPSTDTDGAKFVAEKIRVNVEALAMPHERSDAADHVTISLGFASLVPQQGGAITELITAADRALYQAKHSGRNRAVSATAESVEAVN